MGRTPDDRLGHEAALEVCRRQGVKAMLEGSIARAGPTSTCWRWTPRTARPGRPSPASRPKVEGKERVLGALGKMASRLRGTLGESLASIQRFDVPIEQITTPSLEALHAFTLGQRARARGSEIESIPFFQRAVELDPKFASAYTMLSTVYSNLGEAESAQAVRAAGLRAARSGERARAPVDHVPVLLPGDGRPDAGHGDARGVEAVVPPRIPAREQPGVHPQLPRTVRARGRRGPGGDPAKPLPRLPVLEPGLRLSRPGPLRRGAEDGGERGRPPDRDPAHAAAALPAGGHGRGRAGGGATARVGPRQLARVRHGGGAGAGGGVRGRRSARRAGSTKRRRGWPSGRTSPTSRPATWRVATSMELAYGNLGRAAQEARRVLARKPSYDPQAAGGADPGRDGVDRARRRTSPASSRAPIPSTRSSPPSSCPWSGPASSCGAGGRSARSSTSGRRPLRAGLRRRPRADLPARARRTSCRARVPRRPRSSSGSSIIEASIPSRPIYAVAPLGLARARGDGGRRGGQPGGLRAVPVPMGGRGSRHPGAPRSAPGVRPPEASGGGAERATSGRRP